MPGGVGLLFVVGQVALASITDPSGQVLVVGDVVDGVNDCVQDGSVGFFVQSTGGGGGVIPCSFASPMSQSLVLRFLSRSVTALLSGRSHFSICVSHFPVIGLYTSPGLQLSGTHLWVMESIC